MKRGAVLIFLVLLAVIPAGGFPITGHAVEVSPADLTIMPLAAGQSPSMGMGSVKIFIVDDATFAVLAGASVTVFDQSGVSMGTQAVGAGGASFMLPPGRYAAEARAAGYQSERADFSISVAAPRSLTIPLRRAAAGQGTAKVKVFDASRVCAANQPDCNLIYSAKVVLYDSNRNYLAAKDTSGGAAVFTGLLDGRYLAEASAQGFNSNKAEFTVRGTGNAAIPLTPLSSGTGSLMVRVWERDPSCATPPAPYEAGEVGRPIDACSLLYTAKVELYSAARQLVDVKTTAVGFAFFQNIPAGDYIVRATAPGHSADERSVRINAGAYTAMGMGLKKEGSVPPIGPELPVYLNVKFQMSQGQTAVVRDYQDMRITLAGISPACPAGQACLAAAPSAYFRVTASGSGGGGSTPAIRFIHPKSGDSWRAGDRREIYWRYPEALQGRLMSEELGLYRNEQYVSGLFVRQRIAERKGRFNWTIPAALPAGEYRVRLLAGDLAGTGEYTATSDLFRIKSEVSCGLNCAFDGNCMPGCGAGGCPADPDCQCLTNADCPSGFVCAGGRCQQTDRCNNCNSNGVCNYGCEANGCGRDPDCAGSDCVDTDGGLNALVLGEARDTRGGYFRDVCLSDSAVKEAYCTGSSSFGNVDVVLATDVSGSMDDTFPGQIPGCPAGNKREIAKCVEKQFVDAVLAANSRNRVGLVSFAGSILDAFGLSRDATAIKNVISGYASCVSCGIRGAEQLLDAQSPDSQTAKAIVIMTDGRANVCYGNSRCTGLSPITEMVEFACAAKAKGYSIWAVGYGLDSVAAANLQQAACCDDCSHFANGADAAALSRIYSEYARQIYSMASVTGAAAGASSSGPVAATQTLSCPQGTMCRGGACVQSTCPAQCVADPARACDPRCGQGTCPPDPDCAQACPYPCRGDNFCDTRCALNAYCASDPDCAGLVCPYICAQDQQCVAQCATTESCNQDPDCGCRSNADCPPATSRWCEGARACTGITQAECTQPGTPSARCVVSPFTAATCMNCQNGCSNGVCRSTTASCADSDNGINYTVPGTVLFNGSEYRDRCLNDLYIEENYCHNNARWSLTQPCNGRCQDGACRTNQPTGCPIDSDGGLNYDVAGQISYQGTVWADTCKSGRVLSEATCTQVQTAWLYDIRVVDYTCPNGCANGACMAVPPQCLDADRDGYNRPVAGMHALCMDKIDCNDANARIYPGAQEVCGNGVDEDCTGADLPCSTTCRDSDGGRTYNILGAVTVPGSSVAVADTCPYENQSVGGSPLFSKALPGDTITSSQNLLKERFCSQWGQLSTEEYWCPGACRNGACQGGSVGQCSDGTANGRCSATKPKLCQSGTLSDACTVCGCPSGQTCQAGGTCGSASSCPIDSDGGLNYDVAGQISYQGTVWADTCKSGRVLSEATCTQVTAAWLYDIRVVDYTCPNGCSNGACLASPPSCIDADRDGYNRPVAGMHALCMDKIDCNDNNARIYPAAQEVCGNAVDEDCTGADLPCSTTCTDSDGGRAYFVRGSVSIPGAGPALFDSCPYENSTGSGSPLYAKPPPQIQVVNPLLKERYCEGAQLRTEEWRCPIDCRDGACERASCPAQCVADAARTCDTRCGRGDCPADPDCAQVCPYTTCRSDGMCDTRCAFNANCASDPDCAGPVCSLNCAADQRCVAQCAASVDCQEDPDCAPCATNQECQQRYGSVNWVCNANRQCAAGAYYSNCPISCGAGDVCNSACANTAGCPADPDCPLPAGTSSPLFSKIMFVGGAVKALAGEIDDELAAVPELLPPEIPAPGPLEQEFTLTVGDRRSVFGATLMLMDIQGSRATLAVLAGTQDGGGMPVCSFVGTKDEGWYIGDRLIKKEECGCRAVCKEIGKSKEGWYSSCTKKLILQTKCSDQARLTSTMGGTPLSLVQNADTGLLELQSAETASTAETLLVEDGRVAMRTAAGDREVNILPEDARALAEEYGLTGVTSIRLENRGGRPVYRVAGRMERRFLGIFLRSQAADVFVDAQTGEVI